jgi:ribonucleoside-diphosphate reductase beta chain
MNDTVKNVATSRPTVAMTRKQDEKTEPILSEEQRHTLYPIQHMDIWDLYKKQLASFWTADEIDFSKDREEWDTALSDNERRFVKHVLAFFAGTNTIVALNLMDNFCKEVQVLEAQIAYTYQAMTEGIHSEVYSMMIDVYIKDPAEKAALFRNMGDVQSVLKKMAWAESWALNDHSAPFSHRLVAFAIVEGLFFSGAFCAIYWLKTRNLLPGLTKSNEFIARDEGMHTEFACVLYGKLEHTKMTEPEVHSMFRDAVVVEKEFITESIPCRLIGMNAELMSTYIEHVADRLLMRLGYTPLYGSPNPFPFMDLIGMVGRSNFFEERVSLYQRANVMNNGANDDLTYDDEF